MQDEPAPRTVLLAEDDDDIFDLLSYILRSRGLRVLRAITCKDLVRIAGAAKVDLLLLDIHLADGISTDVIAAIRRIRGTQPTPILAMTSHFSVRIEEQTRAAAIGARLITERALALLSGRSPRAGLKAGARDGQRPPPAVARRSRTQKSEPPPACGRYPKAPPHRSTMMRQ